MKKHHLLLLAFIVSLTNVFGQVPTLSWVKGIGGTLDDYGTSIKVDPSGNVYSFGHFNGTADFDPSPGTFNLTSAGNEDVFVTKLDSGGNLIWAKRIGGTGIYDYGNSISLDQAGNIYIAGIFTGTVDFNPGAGVFNMTSAGIGDFFICKLDINGNFIWAKRIGGGNGDSGKLYLDNTGNIYATGNFGVTVDFDPGPGTYNLTSAGGSDIFVLKLDVNGNFIWAKNMGGTGSDAGSDIVVGQNGDVYTTGDFSSSPADFDPGPGTYNLNFSGSNDIFVSKLDSNGNFVWAKHMAGGTFNDIGTTIGLDDNGNVYTSGFFNNTIDFDPGVGIYNLTSEGLGDIFVSKLSSAGNFIWAKRIGGNNEESAQGMIINENSIYISGTFRDTVDFDPGPGISNFISSGIYDGFLLKMDTAANFGWAGSFGAAGNEIGLDLTLDDNGSLYTTGYFSNTVDFDLGPGMANLTSFGVEDVFICKFQGTVICTPSSSSSTVSSCSSYLWPVNGITYFSSGVYNDTIPNLGGCDSVITLNLTINNNTASSQSATACNNYTWSVNGNNYVSSGSYNATIPNFHGCDSVITINLAINNNTSSSQNVTSCDNYTWSVNGNNYTSSGSYNATIPNAVGCDSMITLNLTINNGTSSSQSATACNNYTWPVNGSNYTTSGSYNATVPNTVGCDSLITLTLTINTNTSSTINAADCQSYLSPSGNYTWTTTGSHLDTIPNSNGCDSIITVMLTIHGMPTVSYTETTTPACVYWAPFTLTAGIPLGGEYSGLGVAGNSFDPTVTGMGNHPVIYQYTDGNNCANTDTSFIQVNDCLGLEEWNNNPVVLYPNPNQGIFTIDVPADETIIKLYDIQGKLIHTLNLIADQNHLSLDLGKGVYHVYIYSPDYKDKILKLVVW